MMTTTRRNRTRFWDSVAATSEPRLLAPAYYSSSMSSFSSR